MKVRIFLETDDGDRVALPADGGRAMALLGYVGRSGTLYIDGQKFHGTIVQEEVKK